MTWLDKLLSGIGICLIVFSVCCIRYPAPNAPTIRDSSWKDSPDVIETRAKAYLSEMENYRARMKLDEEVVANRPKYELFWFGYLIVGGVLFLYGVRNT